VLEKRFEREELQGEGTSVLTSCYRVSRTHVNCYAEYHSSAESCEENLWRVWETPNRRHNGWFTMNTQGRHWGACPTE
jgi:hypothetical protein